MKELVDSFLKLICKSYTTKSVNNPQHHKHFDRILVNDICHPFSCVLQLLLTTTGSVFEGGEGGEWR